MELKLKEEHIERLRIVSGRLPEREFSLKSIDLSNEHLPISSCNGPESLFPLKLIILRLKSRSIPFGISPTKSLPERSSARSSFGDQSPPGNEPESLLNERFKDTSVEQEPTLAGITPENAFPARERARREPHCEKNSSGIEPERLLLLRSMYWRLGSLVREGFRVPEKLLLERESFRRD